jgi:putative SOS response-associated peptidase YedK
MIVQRPIYNLLMCGRYRLSRRKQLVEEYFDAGSDESDWTPRYNIAPTQPVPPSVVCDKVIVSREDGRDSFLNRERRKGNICVS